MCWCTQSFTSNPFRFHVHYSHWFEISLHGLSVRLLYTVRDCAGSSLRIPRRSNCSHNTCCYCLDTFHMSGSAMRICTESFTTKVFFWMLFIQLLNFFIVFIFSWHVTKLVTNFLGAPF